jgi:DNA transposition AAA+ family ATPase
MTENADIKTRVKELIDSGQMSQTLISKQIGLSTAVINQYLQDKYKGDVDGLEVRLKRFFNQREEIGACTPRLKFAQTSIANSVFDSIRLCRRKCGIHLLIGSSGLGKTTAIKEFERENNGVIFIDPGENTSQRRVLQQIATKLRVYEEHALDDFADAIAEKLEDSRFVIVVDESENLDVRCLQTLRKIHDKCNFTFGLLLVGTERFINKLRRLQGEYVYILNRISYSSVLDKLSRDDIRLLVEQFHKNPGSSIVKSFEFESGKNCRELSNLLDITNDIAASGLELTPQLIASARNKFLRAK